MSAFAAIRAVCKVMPPWLTLRGVAVLLLLADAPEGARRCCVVAADIDLPAPSASRVFDTLAAHGLLRRIREDGRKQVYVALTPEGAALARKLEAALLAGGGA